VPRINPMFEPASQSLIASREIRIDSFEQLRAATPTSNAEIIQIEAGRMEGRLKHATVAGLSLGFGTFSRGLISRGVYSGERVTIGFLFESRTGRSRPIGNIRFWPPGMEHERRTLVASLSAHSQCRSTTWRVSLDRTAASGSPGHGKRPFGFVRIAKRQPLPRTDCGRSWRALRVGLGGYPNGRRNTGSAPSWTPRPRRSKRRMLPTRSSPLR